MKIVFTKDYLADLYEGNVRKHKQFRSNPQLVKQYGKTIDKLKSITSVEQLYQINSLQYEKKEGNLNGVSAVWVNKQYRILFIEKENKETLTVDVFEIEDLSKHYE